MKTKKVTNNKEVQLRQKQKTKFSLMNFLCCREETPVPDPEWNGTSLVRPSTTMDTEKLLVSKKVDKIADLASYDLHSYANSYSSQRLSASNNAIVYPELQVFILGQKFKIVAKITKVKVAKSSSNKGTFVDSDANILLKDDSFAPSPIKKNEKVIDVLSFKKEIFSLFEQGITADEWMEITPEEVAKHIAKRLSCDVVIDALCGFGGNTIQFANHCNFVIGIDIDPKKTQGAKHNAEIYQVHSKIDFVTSDFLKIRNLSGDVVYLAPSEAKRNPVESFSILKHMEPELTGLLAKSLGISHCIAIKLPKETELDELAKFFNITLDVNELYSKRFCVEIEKIMNSADELECYVIYFGDCSSINEEQEYEAIYEYLARYEPPDWKHKYSFAFVCKIIEKVGIRKSFKFMAEIEDKFFNESKIADSIFEAFIERLIFENIFTLENIKRIQEIESKRRPGFKPNNRNQGMQNKPGSSLGLLEDSGTRSKPKLSDDLSRFGSPSSPYYVKEKSPTNLDDKYNTPMESPTKTKNLFDAASFKNSLEVSDLAVSSYDVSNSYFNEDNDGFEEGRALRRESEDQPLGMYISSYKNDGTDELFDSNPRERNLTQLAMELNNGVDDDDDSSKGKRIMGDSLIRPEKKDDTMRKANMSKSGALPRKNKKDTKKSFGAVDLSDDDDSNEDELDI